MPKSKTANKPYPPNASLTFWGKELDPKKITDMLGVKPERSFKRGDKRKSDNKPWPHGFWILRSSGHIKSLDPLLHIGWLLKQVGRAQKKLNRISKDKTIDSVIDCFWIMPSSHEVLIIDPDLLKRIAKLNIRFELSVYSP